MVALTIGLIGILAITQVYVVSEEQKRTTVSGGEAQQNGILSLQFIQQDLLMAGYGIVGIGMGCLINVTNTAATPSTYTLQLVPAVIRPDDPAVGTDSITVMYSTAVGAGAGLATINVAHPTTAANFFLDNTIGFSKNDFIVAFQPGKPCTLIQTTNDPTLPKSNTLVHNSGLSTFNVPENSNFPQSPPFATSGYDAGSLILNLGQSGNPNVRYQISNNRLVQVNLADGSNAVTELADGIVAIRAQYGIDTALPNPAVPANMAVTPPVPNGDGLVDVYVDPRAANSPPAADGTPTAGTPNHAAFGIANQAQIAAGWGRVYTIRVAIVSRSSLREKTAVSPATIPLYPGAVYTIPDPNYRYKVYHTIVPVRNMIWRRPDI
jgi:type IV pilus assembly protein PilW